MSKRVSSPKKAAMVVSAVITAGLVSTVVVGLSTAGPAGSAPPDPTTVSYASTTDPPVPLPNVGVESSGFAELGSEVTLSSPGPLDSVMVTMSSLQCESGTWNGNNCETTPGHTFPVPITLTIYSGGQGNAAGPKIATDTGTFDIPFRPSASAQCENDAPGAWYFTTTGTCHFSFPANITFSNFTFSNGFAPDQPLPGTVIYGIAYNTTTNGYNPTGTPNDPANNLNIALSQNVTAGANASHDSLFMAAPPTNNMTCDTIPTGSPPPFLSYNVVTTGPNGCGMGSYNFPAVIINTTSPPVTTTTTTTAPTTTTVPTTTTTTGTGPTTTGAPTTIPPPTVPPPTVPPPINPPLLPPFPHAGVSYPNAAIVTFGANHYVFAGGRAFQASASELAAVQKVDPAKTVAAPGGIPAPTSVLPRPGVTVFTQPVNGSPTIYVVGTDGQLHPFATPTQFLQDGYNGANVITVPNLGGVSVGSNAGKTLTALVTRADGAIVNLSGTFYTFAGGRAFGVPTAAALLELRKTNSAVELQGSVPTADTHAPMADGVVPSVSGPVYVSYMGALYPFKTTTQLANAGYGGTPAVPTPHTSNLPVIFHYSQALSLRASPRSS